MIKKLLIIIAVFSILTIASTIFSIHVGNTGEPGDMPEPEPIQPIERAGSGEFEAEIEHEHDILSGSDIFVRVLVHPAAGDWPGVTGDYAETVVACVIRIRGISVPDACQTFQSRTGRPLVDIRRERSRWNSLLDYKWSLLKLHRKLKLRNPVLLSDGVVECDVFFHLGEAWHNLGAALTNDEHARTNIGDGLWDWGSLNVDLYPSK